MISFKVLDSSNSQEIELIAEWYDSEWKIPVEKTKSHLNCLEEGEFQVVMYLNDSIIGTGGIYNHVGIINHIPSLGIHKHWLALVYTVNEERGKGYGMKLCQEIQDKAIQNGLFPLHLFTDTAESLYHRLGWKIIERIKIGEREVALMRLD